MNELDTVVEIVATLRKMYTIGELNENGVPVAPYLFNGALAQIGETRQFSNLRLRNGGVDNLLIAGVPIYPDESVHDHVIGTWINGACALAKS